jgi:hypothetical protein
MLIMTIGPAADRPPDAVKPGIRRSETGNSLRQNAVDLGFHSVLAGAAHPDRGADGVGVS